MRFLPHYGLKDMERFVGVADTGMDWTVAPDFQLKLVPAHFLHSEGHLNVYDPVSRILFSGDIGSATMPVDRDDAFVGDFNEHVHFIERFHRRFMNSNRAIRCWLDTIAALDIAMIAPQHGPIYAGENVRAFLDWFRELRCGTDLLQPGGHFDMDEGR